MTLFFEILVNIDYLCIQDAPKSFLISTNCSVLLNFVPGLHSIWFILSSVLDDDDCFYYYYCGNNVVIEFGTLSSFLT